MSMVQSVKFSSLLCCSYTKKKSSFFSILQLNNRLDPSHFNIVHIQILLFFYVFRVNQKDMLSNLPATHPFNIARANHPVPKALCKIINIPRRSSYHFLFKHIRVRMLLVFNKSPQGEKLGTAKREKNDGQKEMD